MLISKKKISDYALIGDCHSAALVASDGSIDWACFPRFDSGSVFANILDNRKGGGFLIAPVNITQTKRNYIKNTNVLVTNFYSDQGHIRVTDCMPLREEKSGDELSPIESYHSILRKVECISGDVEVRMVIAPRFEYGFLTPRFTLSSPNTCEIVGGADALWVTCSHALNIQNRRVKTRWKLKAGETVWIDCSWSTSFTEKKIKHYPSIPALQKRLDETIAFWENWILSCVYKGEYPEMVIRSALVLKALTYDPTGAVVAAPTTSLPEGIGGERNWDYRYTWIRDTSLTLTSLLVLGFTLEAKAYRRFIRRTSAGRAEDLQIMSTITGQRMLPEVILKHLSGHRNSYPVRIGNGAAHQTQLDTYGQLLDIVYLYTKIGGEMTPTNWVFVKDLADIVAKKWQTPDQGIWEVRDDPRHFVYSKVQCWLALDRTISISRTLNYPGNDLYWESQKKAIYDYLYKEGVPDGYFTQAVGHKDADAVGLLLPAVGFISVKDPVMQKTIQFIRKELEDDGLLLRYKNKDGLDGDEGRFLLCSFWLIDCLIHSGEIEEAEGILNKVLSLANDVGLFAEEVDSKTGEHLGNFPQAFTHMALVTSCIHLSMAKQGKIPDTDKPYSYSEFALTRLKNMHKNDE